MRHSLRGARRVKRAPHSEDDGSEKTVRTYHHHVYVPYYVHKMKAIGSSFMAAATMAAGDDDGMAAATMAAGDDNPFVPPYQQCPPIWPSPAYARSLAERCHDREAKTARARMRREQRPAPEPVQSCVRACAGATAADLRALPFILCDLKQFGKIKIQIGTNEEEASIIEKVREHERPRPLCAPCRYISGLEDLETRPHKYYVYVSLEIGPLHFLRGDDWLRTKWHYHVTLAYLKVRIDLDLATLHRKLSRTLEDWLRSRVNPMARPANEFYHKRQVIVYHGSGLLMDELCRCDVGSLPPCLLRSLVEEGAVHFAQGSGPPRKDQPEQLLNDLLKGHAKVNQRWKDAYTWEQKVPGWGKHTYVQGEGGGTAPR